MSHVKEITIHLDSLRYLFEQIRGEENEENARELSERLLAQIEKDGIKKQTLPPGTYSVRIANDDDGTWRSFLYRTRRSILRCDFETKVRPEHSTVIDIVRCDPRRGGPIPSELEPTLDPNYIDKSIELAQAHANAGAALSACGIITDLVQIIGVLRRAQEKY